MEAPKHERFVKNSLISYLLITHLGTFQKEMTGTFQSLNIKEIWKFIHKHIIRKFETIFYCIRLILHVVRKGGGREHKGRVIVDSGKRKK